MPESTDGPRVSVRGEVTVEVEPEIARMTLTVFARDKDRRRTLDRLAQRNDEVRALIKGYGEAIEELGGGGLTVYPDLRDRRTEKVRGYRGVVRLRVTIGDFTVLGELAGRLADQEMIEVDGPSWELRTGSPVYRRARQDAARAAVLRAREYAEAIGARLTGVIELADVGVNAESHMPMPAPRGMRSMAAAYRRADEDEPPSLDLEPETQVVEASVEARFTMTQPDDL